MPQEAVIYCLRNDTQQPVDLIFRGQVSQARVASKYGRFFSPVSFFLVSNKDNPVFIPGRPWTFDELQLFGWPFFLLTDGRYLSTTRASDCSKNCRWPHESIQLRSWWYVAWWIIGLFNLWNYSTWQVVHWGTLHFNTQYCYILHNPQNKRTRLIP